MEGRPVSALRIGARSGDNDDDPRRGILLVAGTHARELMNPECLVDLAWQLVISYLLQTDIVLGSHVCTFRDVKRILESIDVYLVLCVNPDGHEYVLTTDETWRRNRRPDPDPAGVGVDLNRNADFMWGVTDGYTSCRPDDETYAGPAPFSEPETRNVKYQWAGSIDDVRIYGSALNDAQILDLAGDENTGRLIRVRRAAVRQGSATTTGGGSGGPQVTLPARGGTVLSRRPQNEAPHLRTLCRK